MTADVPITTRSTSYWDFGDRKEDPIHRIHAYPAKFPAFITTKALLYAQRRGVDVSVVADVFCGCGTTAVEAKRNGKSFWGCDINPLATLIAQVKTRRYRDSGLEQRFQAINREYQVVEPSSADRDKLPARIQYWFDECQINRLLRLRQAIYRKIPRNSFYRKFFFCAFSNILKPTSRWLTKSIKPQIDPNKSPRHVMEAFADQITLMRKANQCNTFPTNPPVCIKTRNFLAPATPRQRPDLIVTSPPYVTSYNYADIHQLSALWLGYTSDYRTLRKHMLGNAFGVKPLRRAVIEGLGATATDAYHGLLTVDRRKAVSVARYFFDMNRTVAKCFNMLRHNGMAVFVIGNTNYQGVRIDNRRHLVRCMTNAGFHDVRAYRRKVSKKIMTPYRDARGRFTRDSSQQKVYGEEFVVAGRRR